MRNKSILTKTMRRLMLMVLLVTQVVMGTSSAFADTVTGSVTFDSSVWGTTNRQFDNGSTQTWTNYLTLTLNPVTAGDNCRISGGYLGLYHQSTLEITAPVGCTITGMTIAGSNYGGTPSTTPGSLTSEPGSTSYTWTGSSSSVTISTDAGEHDSYDFQSIVVTYETSLDAMATTTSNGAIYSFNQNPNPFFGVSLYAKTITAGNQEMYFDAFGSDDPMIMQNLVDSSFYLHMPAQSRLRLQRSDSSSDIYITKAVFTFVSGSPSISPDGGTYNSSTHTWTGQESQIIFLFNEEADIQLIESEAGLVTASNHTVNITCGEYGSISGKVLDFTGTSTEDFQVASGAVMPVSVPDGYSVELTFVPAEGYYLSSVMRDDVEDIVSFVEDGKITLTSITSDMSLNTTFSRMEMFLQIDSHTDFGSVNWQVTDVLAGDVITNGMVKNAVDDIPVPYGSTVKLTFAYDQTQYGLSQLTRNGANILSEVSENTYTITNYATNDTIVVDFVQLVSEPYAVLANDTVTFYYDTHKEERDGIVVINNSEITASPYGTATAAVFDASFVDYLPTSTAYLFYKCSSLTSITNIEYLNTANVTDMSYMFAECSSLTSLTVSFLNTAKVTDMHNMFFGCSGLTGLDLSGFDTSATTTMASMFSGCTNLQEVMFGENFNTANVTDMSYMFAGCNSLTNLYGTWTSFNTTKVTNMSGMFFNCSGLTTLDVSSFTTDIVTDMSYMFAGCSGLISLDLSGFNTANVTETSYMFSRCTGLTDLNLSGFNTVNVTDMSAMFENCTSLTTLDISDFNTAKVTNMSGLFVDCSALTTIYAGSGWSTSSVEGGVDMFENCNSLVGGKGTVYDASHTDYNYAHIDGGPDNPGYFSELSRKNLTAGDYFQWDGMGANAQKVSGTPYTNCNYILGQSVGVPYGDPNTYAYAYADLSGYDRLEVTVTAGTPRFLLNRDTEDGQWNATESESHMIESDQTGWSSKYFSSSDGVWTVDLKQIVADKGFAHLNAIKGANWGEVTITKMELIKDEESASPEPYAVLDGTTLTFYYDKKKSQREGAVEINSSNYASAVTAVFDESFANYYPTSTVAWFHNCSNLTTITGIEYLKTDSVTSMLNMFYDCSSLTSLDLSSFNTENVTSMSGMFHGCSGLTSLDVSSFNTANVKYMSTMFSFCRNLTSIATGGFNTANVESMQHMFDGCSGLTTLDLSGFNTAKVTMIHDMFAGCSNLISLDLSSFNTSLVKNITDMFSGCSKLTTIYVSSDWDFANIEDGSYMFHECINLVGGMGTTYDAEHTDYTYAHIDEGSSNPGYFTPKGDYVEAPTFAWNADELTMTSGTEGASIYYTLTDAVTSSPTPTQYAAPVTVTSDVLIEAYAEKDGMARSMTTTLNYPYTAWKALVSAVADAQNVLAQATTNDNVTAEQRDSLVNFINTAQSMYEARIDSAAAITQFTTDLTTLTETIRQLVNVENEPYAVLDGTTLTFYYDKKKAERNGMSVGPFENADYRGWDGAAGSIKTVVFDSSMDNCYSITSTAAWFWNCTELEKVVDLKYLHTDNVTNMNNMFGVWGGTNSSVIRTNKLDSLDVSHFNTVKVENMDGLFYHCGNLKELDLSNFDTRSVVNMYTMFADCRSLSKITFGENFNTENVTEMGAMFQNCSSLTSLDLSLFNTVKVSSIWGMFNGCSALETIYAGNNWSMENVQSGTGVFEGCVNLVGGKGTTYDASHVDVAYAHIDGGPSNPGYFTPKSGYVEAPTFAWNADELTITSGTDGATIYYTLTDAVTSTPTPTQYTAPITVTSDVLIEAYAEKDGMARSMTTTLNYPYTAWKALVDAIADAQNVLAQATTNDNVTAEQRDSLVNFINTAQGMYEARIDSAAAITQFTTDLTTLTKTVRQAVEAVAEPYAVLAGNTLTFYYDKQKEQRGGMDIGEWDEAAKSTTMVVVDASFASYHPTSTVAWFAGLTKLASIEGMSNLKTDSVTNMWNMFGDCISLMSIDLSGLKTDKVENMGDMFGRCSGLTSLDVSNLNTENVNNMQGMFAGCKSLMTLDLSGFKTDNVSSMYSMFSECSSLKTIYVGDGWSTANNPSSEYMFAGCTSLVGGMGTVFDENHVDASYAHLDGGPSNPGYFTLPLSMGDVNGDGSINIADAVATVTNILGQPTEENFYKYAADMNNDDEIDIFDVTLIVNAALSAPAPGRRGVTRSGTDEVPAEAIQLMADAHNVYMDIDQAQQYTALQFDIDLPEGTELLDVKMAGATNHQLSFVKRGENQYRVVALSMSNEVFRSANGHLVQLQVSNAAGEGDVKMSDVLFVKPSGKTVTGISEHLNATMAADDSIYDLNGRYVGNDRRQLSKGIYIINHKKVNIK